MARVIFENLGRVGIVRDQNPAEIPLEAWSDGNNVRFYEDSVQRLLGHSTMWTPTIDPWYLLPVQTTAQLFWIYPGATQVYVVNQAGTHTDITRAAGVYAADFNIGWNGGIFNTIPILNNGADVPQMWSPAALGTRLVDLTAWPANVRARVVRPLRNFLVALDITRAGTRYPLNVLWSHSAVPGNVPSSWDVTDPTKDAGENSLAETAGFVIDMYPLRDVGVVYKEDSTWIMQYVGGAAVFRFVRMRRFGGILTRNCVRAFDQEGEKHFVITRDDVVVHDGQTSTSIVDKRVRRAIFNLISETTYQRTHVAHNPLRKEMIIALPSFSGQNTRAAIWNYSDNRWSFRDLPSVNYVECGQLVTTPADVAWDADPALWNTDQSAWDDRPFSPAGDKLVFARPGASKALYLADNTNQFNGSNFLAFVERTGLNVIGKDRAGNPIYDTEAQKLVTELWPRIEGTAGVPVEIKVGYQNDSNDAVTWTPPFIYTIGQTTKINPYVGGKLLAVRFEMPNNAFFRLFGYDLELVVVGKNYVK